MKHKGRGNEASWMIMAMTRISDFIQNWSFSATVSFLIVSAVISSWIQLQSFVWQTDPFDDIPAVKYPVNDKSNILDDKLDKIFWFVQISDLHLSINFDPTRGTDLERWCNEVTEVIKPKVILATGDLTDSRTKTIMAGKQYEEEWVMYQDIINRTGVTKKALWLDLRGNHDDFGVFDWKSDNNYFAKYSVQGKLHRRHYTYTVRDKSETYSFIGVDSCLEPGPNKPFNTLGLLHEEDIDSLKALKRETTQVSPNMTIWFGHYPTRVINGPIPGLHNIINGPYLSGHVHMTNLYALQPAGFLDIEVADWKWKRMYRVAAIDHSIFSFTDTRLDEWPVIVITNPKSALLFMPKIEAINRIETSTHIRVLVFSKSKLTKVTAEINNEGEIAMNRVGDSPLFVISWNPSHYSSGLHRITVRARDEGNHYNEVSHLFSLDGSREEFSLKSKIIMTFMHQTIFGCAFLTAVWSLVIPLFIIRWCIWSGKLQSLKDKCTGTTSFAYNIIVRFYLLCCVNKMFLPVISVPLYLSFGPWLTGEVIEGHFGISFVWGTLIAGYFLPGGISYLFALIFTVVVQFPFILCLSYCVHCRFQSLVTPSKEYPSSSLTFNVCNLGNFVMFLILCLHFFVSYIYGNAYGLSAWFFGFAHTWTLAVNIYSWWSSHRLELSDFKGFTNNIIRSSIYFHRKDDDSSSLLKDKDRTD